MSPEFLQPPGYIAVNPAIGYAIGRGKKSHAIPNMVMRYLSVTIKKIAKWQLLQ